MREQDEKLLFGLYYLVVDILNARKRYDSLQYTYILDEVDYIDDYLCEAYLQCTDCIRELAEKYKSK